MAQTGMNCCSKLSNCLKTIYKKLNYVRGVLKIFCWLFVIICLILARTGFAEGTAHFLALVDTEWVTITSVCSYTFIYPMLIICYLMGEVVPIKLEIMIQVLGFFLFVASGSLLIDRYQAISNLSDRDVGLALGSMLIITGIFMLLDALIMLFNLYKKKNRT